MKKIFIFIKKILLIKWIKPFTSLLYKFSKKLYFSFCGDFEGIPYVALIYACRILAYDFGLLKSIVREESLDSNGNPIPWYSYPAIEFLSQFDFSEKQIFEFGSGNSTIWWGNRGKSVVSVEHNPDWYQKMINAVPANVMLYLESDKCQYLSRLNQQFDIIIIDAIWRDECVRQSLKHIADSGMIIIDDAQRVHNYPEYQQALQQLQTDSRFIEIDFTGFTPIANFTKITSVFISRKNNFKRKNLKTPDFGIGNLRDEHD